MSIPANGKYFKQDIDSVKCIQIITHLNRRITLLFLLFSQGPKLNSNYQRALWIGPFSYFEILF